MWVSARGDVETYASEALQSRLDDWFVKGGIAEEAKELVTGSTGEQRSNPFLEGESASRRGSAIGGEELSDDEGLGDDSFERSGSPMSHPTGSTISPTSNNDPFLDNNSQNRIRSLRANRKAIAPLDTNVANDLFLRNRDADSRRGSLGMGFANLNDSLEQPPKSAPLPSNEFRDTVASGLRTSTPISRFSLSRTASNNHAPQVEVRLENEAARTAFLELRFGQLQQGVCKTVAKAWIKIIEPKKQTRCPYNKGEEGKPTWWPEGVRHKEPDHLMKPERHALLLTILRSPKVQVARLQLATAEVVALIKADKVSLLMDVYRIAREEEKMREAKVDTNTPMTVGVSTLDGWSDAEQGPTTDGLHLTRSVSPEPTETKVGIPARKRSLAQTMSRSASTSAVNSNKRRSIAGAGDASKKAETMARTNSASNAPDGWSMDAAPDALRQQQQANAQAASVAASVAAASGQVPSQFTPSSSAYHQVHGLVTPLTGSAQLMDPAYMAAAAGDHGQFGYGMYYADQNMQHRASQGSLFAYGGMSQPGSQEGQTLGQASALGLQGVPVPNDGDWNTMAPMPMQSQLDLSQQSQHWPQHGTPTAAGDASFNTSFDTTGPRTPSPVNGQLRLNLDREKMNEASMQFQHMGMEHMHAMMPDQNAVNFEAWVRSQTAQQP